MIAERASDPILGRELLPARTDAGEDTYREGHVRQPVSESPYWSIPYGLSTMGLVEDEEYFAFDSLRIGTP
jgi:hypothetical protein